MFKSILSVLPVLSVVSLVLGASLFLQSYPQPSTLELTYEISSDVVPYAVGQGSPPIRYNSSTGKWQRYVLGSWIDISGTPDFSTFLDSYDVATIADVHAASLTVPDVVDALGTYFGSIGGIGFPNTNLYDTLTSIRSGIVSSIGNFPLTYARRFANANGTLSTSVSSLAQLLMTIGSDNQVNFLTGANPTYLDTNGAIQTSSNVLSLVTILRNGLLGLGSDLMGLTGQVSAAVFPYGNTSFVTQQFGSIGSLLASQYSALSRALMFTTGSLYLGPDGTQYTYAGNDSALFALNRGLLGLASILRGQSGNPGNMTFLDYTDLSERNVAAGDILDMLALGTQDIQNLLATYLFSHGTNLDIDIRHNMEDQAESFVDNFTSSSGPGTPSVSDVTDSAR